MFCCALFILNFSKRAICRKADLICTHRAQLSRLEFIVVVVNMFFLLRFLRPNPFRPLKLPINLTFSNKSHHLSISLNSFLNIEFHKCTIGISASRKNACQLKTHQHAYGGHALRPVGCICNTTRICWL